jgi:lambda repressor-like predicted transcriptional regulator
MDPLEIKIELMRAGIRQSDIAHKGEVSTALVARVIARQTTSARIETMIAKAIDKPVALVFPRRSKDAGARKLEKRLAS